MDQATSPFVQTFPPPLMGDYSPSSGDSRISPSILLIIIILSIIFFISGILHLLVRFFIRPQTREPDDLENVTAFQGQLQQLFHLHDAGVDQSFIDTLPVFFYKAIIGLKNPFDCAVCLCEFEAEDKLRLLPKCSHAFHLQCIDTWLLSHSTCPLCRGSLLPDFSAPNCSPVVLVLESGSESSREMVNLERGVGQVGINASQVGLSGEDGFGSSRTENSRKPGEIGDGFLEREEVKSFEMKVVPVKLGKFRNVDPTAGGESSRSVERRCYSMGSFEYVLDNSSLLKVEIQPSTRKQRNKKQSLPPLTPGHRLAMSDCGNSRREGFRGFESKRGEIQSEKRENFEIQKEKRESFSVSKIWLRSKRDSSSNVESSRRAFSFRLPLQRGEGSKVKSSSNVESSRRAFSFRLPLQRGEDSKVKHGSNRGSFTETEFTEWENHDEVCSSYQMSEIGWEEEVGSCRSMESSLSKPSFAKTTLNWLVGRRNKVVHSSPMPPV
ncbi:hypothetical protein AMTRI_Chr12g273960 [Amborella trichopoda]